MAYSKKVKPSEQGERGPPEPVLPPGAWPLELTGGNLPNETHRALDTPGERSELAGAGETLKCCACYYSSWIVQPAQDTGDGAGSRQVCKAEGLAHDLWTLRLPSPPTALSHGEALCFQPESGQWAVLQWVCKAPPSPAFPGETHCPRG